MRYLLPLVLICSCASLPDPRPAAEDALMRMADAYYAACGRTEPRSEGCERLRDRLNEVIRNYNELVGFGGDSDGSEE